MYLPRSCHPGRTRSHANTTGPLPPQTLDDVYFCVRSVLSSLTAGLSSAQSTSFVADMVYSAVHRAVADFAATWNDSAPIILPVLPSELLISCLSHLPLRDKIFVSHVSRGWRRFMLAAPTLWNTVDTSKARFPLPIDVFRVMVARSGAAHLDVNLRSGWHPDETGVDNWPSLLGQVSSRLRSLAILLPMPLHPAFNLFDNFYAPVLEVLRVDARHAPQAVQFPGNGNALMPRLKHLTLDRISIPEGFEPMPGLETFEGHCYDSLDLCDLFTIFPCLVSTALHDLCAPVTRAGAVPPSTLISATISLHSEEVATTVGILQTFTAFPQCDVEFSVTHRPRSVLDTVAALARTHTGPWRIVFQPAPRDPEVRVTVRRCTSDGFSIALASRRLAYSDGFLAIGPDTFSMSPFDRLEALTLSGAALGASVLADAHFPALKELFLVDEDYGPESMLRYAAEDLDPELAPIILPVLRAVTVTLGAAWKHEPDECTVRHLGRFISSRLRYDAETLHQITVDHSPRSNGAQCLALCSPDLDGLASRVLLVNAGGREEWLTLIPKATAEVVEDDMLAIFPLTDDY